MARARTQRGDARSILPVGEGAGCYVSPESDISSASLGAHSSRLRSAPAEPRTPAALEQTIYWTGQLVVGDRNWAMIVTPIPGGTLLSDHQYSTIVLMADLIITACLVMYLGVLKRQQRRLRELRAELQAIFDHAIDGIVLCDLETKRLRAGNDHLCQMLGYTPEELVTLDLSDIHPTAALPRIIEQMRRQSRGELERADDVPVKRKDGSVFFADVSGGSVVIGGKPCLVGIFRDITERKHADELLLRRDALLHAVATSATELVMATSLDDAVAKVLEIVGTTLAIDRVSVLERPPVPNAAPVLRSAWHAPGLKLKLDSRFFEDPKLMTPQIVAWYAPLWEGKIVRADLRTAVGDLRAMLEKVGSKSLLILPVAIDGKYWGQLGFEGCTSERNWLDFEVEKLQLLADLIGNAMQRARYVEEIANANRIVQNTPTILYRVHGEPSLPMFYISQNIRLFGYEPAVLTASPHLYQNLIHPDDVAAAREAMARALDSQSGVVQFRVLTGQGDYRWVEDRFAPVCDAAGRVVEIEGLIFDITERKAAEEKISLLARTDQLTGLPNRATFLERLGLYFASAQRGAAAFAVLYLDLDRFKDVNDTLGHAVGDRLLVTVGERLKGAIRETDVAARLGGDEFAVLQTLLSDSTDPGVLASKIRTALAVPLRIGGSELHVTASVGIAVYTPDSAAPEDMLAQADAALYRAKEEGRDQYRFHTEELDRQVSERVAIADDLRGAIARNQLELYYQPQVELDSGRIVGMEALIRWNHPTRGVVAPATFIPVAETTGTMMAIGQWVLDRACRQLSVWRKAGIAPPIIAVNVSLAQLKKPNEFIGLVSDTLAKWELVPADLELDVTELMLAHSVWAQNNVLQRLQKLGVSIAIDDFGTQYSSLDYLRTYHVSRLKIPRLMVDAAAREPSSAAAVRAIVSIARELNVEVIAQGVETKEQWSFLSATSPITKVQGFYYSEPVPAKRAEALLRQGRIEPATALAQHSPGRSRQRSVGA